MLFHHRGTEITEEKQNSYKMVITNQQPTILLCLEFELLRVLCDSVVDYLV